MIGRESDFQPFQTIYESWEKLVSTSDMWQTLTESNTTCTILYPEVINYSKHRYKVSLTDLGAKPSSRMLASRDFSRHSMYRLGFSVHSLEGSPGNGLKIILSNGNKNKNPLDHQYALVTKL